MNTALWLLAALGTIGTFDTLYYHEWRMRLPARYPEAADELKIHALRDFSYALLFASLPWVAWHGYTVLVVVAAMVMEFAMTMTDFVVEIRVRKPLGDVPAGERIGHVCMGIVYGAMMANLLPVVATWWAMPSRLAIAPAGPEPLRWVLSLMAIGVFLSGVRDLYAAFGLPGGSWPWPRIALHRPE
ncbi:MAG: hypothetical protein EXR75_02710 [Myxococcales bacterium]|nr:hypothetical protein [Myxococcales bacterium]